MQTKIKIIQIQIKIKLKNKIVDNNQYFKNYKKILNLYLKRQKLL